MKHFIGLRVFVFFSGVEFGGPMRMIQTNVYFCCRHRCRRQHCGEEVMVLGSRRQLNHIVSTHSLIYKMIRNQVMIAAAATTTLAVLIAATAASFFSCLKELKTHKLPLLFNQQYILIHDTFVYALRSSICIVASTTDQNSNRPLPTTHIYTHTHTRSHQHHPSTHSVNKNKNNRE